MRERKRPPVHPGRILLHHHLEPLGLTVTDLARILQVSRKTASKIVNERGAITPDMALRLARAFTTTPDLWLNLQLQHDLFRAAHQSSAWKTVRAVDSESNHAKRV
jgi:antitoxin HigA-1